QPYPNAAEPAVEYEAVPVEESTYDAAVDPGPGDDPTPPDDAFDAAEWEVDTPFGEPTPDTMEDDGEAPSMAPDSALLHVPVQRAADDVPVVAEDDDTADLDDPHEETGLHDSVENNGLYEEQFAPDPVASGTDEPEPVSQDAILLVVDQFEEVFT